MAAQSPKPEKCTEELKLRLGTELLVDLRSLAAAQGYDSLSPYIRLVLRRHVYGYATPNRDLLSAGVRDE